MAATGAQLLPATACRLSTMQRRRFLVRTAALAATAPWWLARAAHADTPPAAAPQRVISLGGSVTEIVYALGAEAQLVGTDQSSLYPPAAQALPQVGYFRQLALEGILSLTPNLILAAHGSGPDYVLDKLRTLGIDVHLFSGEPSVDTLLANIKGIAAVLKVEARGAALATRLREELATLAAEPPAVSPSVLILTTHTGQLRAAGHGTAADAVLTLAGGHNLLPATQQGYQTLGAESVADLAPQWILTSPLSLRASGGSLETFAAKNGVVLTPAAKQGRILVLDDLLLLGIGPRLPEAIRTLREQFAQRAGKG